MRPQDWLYKETFFSKDSLFQTEVSGGSYGVAGDAIPYSMQNDEVLTIVLFCLFVLAVITFSNAKGFMIRQAKRFFYQPHEGTSEITETSSEVRFQVCLVFLTSLLLSLICYFYTLETLGGSFVLDSPYLLIVVFLAIILCYFSLRAGLYALVNRVFFDGKRNGQWMKDFIFVTILEGMLLFPAVLLQVYFGLSLQSVEVYFAIVLILVKLLTIYRSYIIFFRGNIVSIQFFLYFCALEIMPLLALWGVLDITANSLKYIF
ncbi:MAG: DUF4271 domain-containing protein [Prevotella sp.]|nr:DUF4271 domain-containing protein [Prevotella sp.]